jgi:hypothetical protein
MALSLVFLSFFSLDFLGSHGKRFVACLRYQLGWKRGGSEVRNGRKYGGRESVSVTKASENMYGDMASMMGLGIVLLFFASVVLVQYSAWIHSYNY